MSISPEQTSTYLKECQYIDILFNIIEKHLLIFVIPYNLFRPPNHMKMAEAVPKPKEAYGQRLLTSIIDDLARSNPQKTFMSIPAGASVIDGQRDVSYADIAQAINRCAWWIVDTLGKGVDFPTIATYLYPTDFRHVILIFGSIKAGYQV